MDALAFPAPTTKHLPLGSCPFGNICAKYLGTITCGSATATAAAKAFLSIASLVSDIEGAEIFCVIKLF
jgi:hypothetical protein